MLVIVLVIVRFGLHQMEHGYDVSFVTGSLLGVQQEVVFGHFEEVGDNFEHVFLVLRHVAAVLHL